MNPLAKKLTTAVLCVTALTSPLFMSGCSFSKIANGVQQGAQKASQQDIKVFNNYIEAIGDFNTLWICYQSVRSKTKRGATFNKLHGTTL